MSQSVSTDTDLSAVAESRERMSDSEAIMWTVEKDPALRSDFCNLSILSHAPDPKRLRDKIEDAIAAIPRLGKRVVSAPLRLAPPEWVDERDLDLDYHVRHVSLPEPGDERALLDMCSFLAETPFDRSRPLWEFTLIDGLANGNVAMLQKLHHTITDGVGGLKLSLALVDFEADPKATAHRAPTVVTDLDSSRSPLDIARDAIQDTANKQIAFAKETLGGIARIAAHPTVVPGFVGDATEIAKSIRRQVVVTEAAHSDVMNVHSLRRHFELLEVDLTPLRDVAHKLGGSLNDIFVTAIAGALGKYHEARGSEVRDLRMAMPVNTRERGDKAANRFAPARVVVPISPADPEERFQMTATVLASVKAERAFGSLERLAGLANALPTSVLVGLTRSQTRTIDFATSNLRGSPVPLYLAGAEIVANFPLGPRTGGALNVTMMTYKDRCHLGFNIDPAAIIAPGEFMDDVRSCFAELAQLG